MEIKIKNILFLVFNNLLVVCLKYIPDVFDHHLNAKDPGAKDS